MFYSVISTQARYYFVFEHETRVSQLHERFLSHYDYKTYTLGITKKKRKEDTDLSMDTKKTLRLTANGQV